MSGSSSSLRTHATNGKAGFNVGSSDVASRGQVRGHIVELSNDISTIGRFGLDSVAACYCTPIVQEASRMHRYLSTFPPLRVLDVARIERSRLFIKELRKFQQLACLVRAGGPTKREPCSIASAFSNGSYAIFARIASAAVDVTDQKRGVALTEQETNHAQQNYSQYG
jgi:hypothetical protein